MRTQRGVSLVELMVAMTIGLFILLLISVVYIEGARNLRFRQGQGENLANSRYALHTLSTQFAKAGYRRDPSQDVFQAFPMTTDNGTECSFDHGQAVKVDDLGALCIRFQPRDADEVDCAGNSGGIAALGPYESPPAPSVGAGMFIEKYYVNASGSLVCQAGDKHVEVVDGVVDIHFEFGIGPITASMADRTVEAYASAASNDDAIRAMRYSILLAASTPQLTGGIDSSVCERWTLESGKADRCNAEDGRLYQIAAGALTLRNLMP